jgi:hypothetical protein
MYAVSDKEGWVVSQDEEIEVDSSELSLSFTEFSKTFSYHGMPDPRIIRGK